MHRPEIDIEGCRVGHQKFNERVASLSDGDMTKPSMLPGWTVAHLLTHVARNADSVVRRLEGAIRDEVLDQYVGGREGRADEIEAGMGRPAAEVIEDVSASSAAVESVYARMPDEAWPRLTRGVSGKEVPASTVAYQRWREVEIHLVDLDLGYTTADLPKSLVDKMLEEALPRLARRTDPNALLGWVLGRGGAPELQQWG